MPCEMMWRALAGVWRQAVRLVFEARLFSFWAVRTRSRSLASISNIDISEAQKRVEQTPSDLIVPPTATGTYQVDESVIEAFPVQGTTIVDALNYGKSLWGKTAKVIVRLPGGDVQNYFLKVVTLGSTGRSMCEGEYESLKAIYQVSPDFVLPLLQTLSTTTTTTTHLALASSTTSSFFRTKTSHLPSLTTHFPPHTCLFRDDADMQTKKGKPAGDIFLLALERINASLIGDVHGCHSESKRVRAEECLVFEDSIAGVAAGRAAGMRVCWVPHWGLREVCAGLEQMVLAGKMEEVEGRLLALEAERVGMGSTEGEEGSMGEGETGGGGKVERIVSEDGWGEMIGSLEEFDYAEYGIRVRD